MFKMINLFKYILWKFYYCSIDFVSLNSILFYFSTARKNFNELSFKINFELIINESKILRLKNISVIKTNQIKILLKHV